MHVYMYVPLRDNPENPMEDDGGSSRETVGNPTKYTPDMIR